MKTLLKINELFTSNSKRFIWRWLNHVWNNYDAKRVKEVGANIACAEWLLKCGAHVKFKNWGTYIEDYNKLPPGGINSFQIEEIKADNSCIMAKGFEYFKELEGVKKVVFMNCELIDDNALAKLSYLKNSLEHLEIIFCPSVTDYGISYLTLLNKIRYLYLAYLPEVKQKDACEKLLKDKLKNCEILFEQEVKMAKK